MRVADPRDLRFCVCASAYSLKRTCKPCPPAPARASVPVIHGRVRVQSGEKSESPERRVPSPSV